MAEDEGKGFSRRRKDNPKGTSKSMATSWCVVRAEEKEGGGDK